MGASLLLEHDEADPLFLVEAPPRSAAGAVDGFSGVKARGSSKAS
jgi:hypothetical protein